MADYVLEKWKPVASQISLLNNGNRNKARGTRLLGFEPPTIGTFIFHLVALVVALVFGAWAIKSYNTIIRRIFSMKLSLLRVNRPWRIIARSMSVLFHTTIQRRYFTVNRIANACLYSFIRRTTCYVMGFLDAQPLENIAAVFSLPFSLQLSGLQSVPPLPLLSTPTRLRNNTITGSTFLARTSTARFFDTTSTTTTSSISSRTSRAICITAAPSGDSPSAPSLGLGAIAGIILGGVAFVGMVIALSLFRLRKRREALYKGEFLPDNAGRYTRKGCWDTQGRRLTSPCLICWGPDPYYPTLDHWSHTSASSFIHQGTEWECCRTTSASTT